MTQERLASDVRDLRRIIERLTRSVDSLNGTLIAIERKRQLEKPPKYCRQCNASICNEVPPLAEEEECVCCAVKHDPEKLLKVLYHAKL